MPAVVGFLSAFSPHRSRLHGVVDFELRTRDIIPVGHRHIFRTVKIDETETAVSIYLAQTFGDLALDAAVLVNAYEERPIVNVKMARLASGRMNRRA